jgi:hypothetical protein
MGSTFHRCLGGDSFYWVRAIRWATYATLNWRRDPGYERRVMLHELRMKQLKSEIELIKGETEQL